jgi:hypothetical protein
MASLSPSPKLQFFGTDGLPLVGGKLYTYAAGTTTPIATYTDHTAANLNTNPVILDSAGQAGVWLTNSFASPPAIGSSVPNVGTFTDLYVVNTLTLESTGAAILNVGTTGERPAVPEEGMVRYNSTTDKFEGYNGAWGALGGGATGGGSDSIFIENGQTVTTNYTMPNAINAMSTGPITINDSVTVTIPDGGRWVVL